jgi:hypothetical protein
MRAEGCGIADTAHREQQAVPESDLRGQTPLVSFVLVYGDLTFGLLAKPARPSQQQALVRRHE